MEYETEDGAPVVFEASDETGSGVRLVSRGGLPTAQAVGTFESALDGARSAAESALRVLREGPLKPDGVEIEFGVKMSAEAGAVRQGHGRGSSGGEAQLVGDRPRDRGQHVNSARRHARIECGRQIGSGFLVTGRKVLACAHVIADSGAAPVTVTFPAPATWSAT
ncbi:CU044_2847 family protein [Streptomyces sp. NPDC051453]|uniref:CU044_2847 family protein n=1 Tax=Streptomyces sp. NPDC051453 TaxID=3154941 RepID=UPI00342B0BB1